ncbi:MAG: hypothetical protein M3Y58_23610 [Chloroflexota bacterium]|nr:hypothetical protein [Chloroflexota bacterium]
MNDDTPLLVRIVTRGPLLGSSTTEPAVWMPAAECERAADRAMLRLPAAERPVIQSGTSAYHRARRDAVHPGWEERA